MPEISQEELQDLKDRAFKSYIDLTSALEEQRRLKEELTLARKLKKNYFIGIVVSIFILLTAIILYFSFTKVIQGLGGVAQNEVVIEKSELEGYKSKISQLQKYLDEERAKNPLNLDEFYTVQLGAFREFDTPLSTGDFSIVNSSKYEDFNLYTLGVFKTEEEAEQLLKVAKELNFKDAFVGKYENGERVDKRLNSGYN